MVERVKKFLFVPQLPKVKSPVYCGSGALNKLVAEDLERSFTSVHAVIDARVMELYGTALVNNYLGNAEVYSFPRGERHKSYNRFLSLLRWLHSHEVDRGGLLIGIGGGVVTDIAGLTASTYKRGIAYIAVPTTILAQVDAAIGGKTAINLGNTKNVVGTIYPPRMVICDNMFLPSLGSSQIKDGVVEALKVFAAYDRRLFSKYSIRAGQLIAGQGLDAMIADAIQGKLSIVNSDPLEKGQRQILNLGHTTGHALEVVCGWSHGKAVTLGILVALVLSRRIAALPAKDFQMIWDCFAGIYGRFDLNGVAASMLWQKIKHDKKRSGDRINFVLLNACGSYRLATVTEGQFTRAFQETGEMIQK